MPLYCSSASTRLQAVVARDCFIATDFLQLAQNLLGQIQAQYAIGKMVISQSQMLTLFSDALFLIFFQRYSDQMEMNHLTGIVSPLFF